LSWVCSISIFTIDNLKTKFFREKNLFFSLRGFLFIFSKVKRTKTTFSIYKISMFFFLPPLSLSLVCCFFFLFFRIIKKKSICVILTHFGRVRKHICIYNKKNDHLCFLQTKNKFSFLLSFYLFLLFFYDPTLKHAFFLFVFFVSSKNKVQKKTRKKSSKKKRDLVFLLVVLHIRIRSPRWSASS